MTVLAGFLMASRALAGIGLQLETPVMNQPGNGNNTVWSLSHPSNGSSSSSNLSNPNGLVPMHMAQRVGNGGSVVSESIYLAFYLEVGTEFVTVKRVAVGASIAELTSLVSDKPHWGIINRKGELVKHGSGATTFSGNVSGSGSVITSGLGTLVLNGTNTSQGSATVSGGTLTLNPNTAVTGNVTVNTSGTLALVGATAIDGTLTINGGNLEAIGGTRTLSNNLMVNGDFGISGTNKLTLSGTIDLTADRTITVANGSTAEVTGVISGTGGLTKSGAGVLNLSGHNTYLGGSTVTAGTLTIGAERELSIGALEISGDGRVDFTSNGSDTTEVTWGDDVTVEDGGEIVVSLATIDGSYKQSGGTLQIVLVDSVLEGERPAIAVTGSATLDGALKITTPEDLTVPMDSRFDLLAADSLTGGFETLIDQTGTGFRLGQDGNTVYLTNSPIPEPTTLGLTVCLAAGLAMRRRPSQV